MPTPALVLAFLDALRAAERRRVTTERTIVFSASSSSNPGDRLQIVVTDADDSDVTDLLRASEDCRLLEVDCVARDRMASHVKGVC